MDKFFKDKNAKSVKNPISLGKFVVLFMVLYLCSEI